jgi:hypothetical protein
MRGNKWELYAYWWEKGAKFGGLTGSTVAEPRPQIASPRSAEAKRGEHKPNRDQGLLDHHAQAALLIAQLHLQQIQPRWIGRKVQGQAGLVYLMGLQGLPL